MVNNLNLTWFLESANANNSGNKPKIYNSIHAVQISRLLSISPKKLLKRVEPMVGNDEFLRRLFGTAEIDTIKSKLDTARPMLDITNREDIAQTPEFQEFFEWYKIENAKNQTSVLQNLQAKEVRKQLHEIDLTEDLQTKKDRFKEARRAVDKILAKTNLKWLINGWTHDALITAKQSNVIDEEDINIIYNFIFDYKETPASKKRRKAGQSSTDFFGANGDYNFGDIIKFLWSQEKKLWEDINQYRKRNEWKVRKQIISSVNQDIDQSFAWHKNTEEDLRNQALDVFIKKIIKWEIKSINTNYYVNSDIADISRAKLILDGWMKKTIPALNFSEVVLDHSQQENTIMKWNRTSMDKYHFNTMRDHNIAFKTWLDIQTPESLRWYIFDRYVEYIWMAITEHRIKDVIKSKNSYKWTTYRILKTDFFDDTFWWADFVVLFKFPWDKSGREEIAAIDLLVSKTKYGNSREDWEDRWEDPNKQKKIENAKKPKYLYSTYAKLLSETQAQWLKLTPLKRIVVEEDARLVYNLLAKLMRWKVSNLDKAVEEYFSNREIKYMKWWDPSDTQITRMISSWHEWLSAVA